MELWCMLRGEISHFWFFFKSRRRHTRFSRDWSSDVCSSDLVNEFWLCENVLGLGERLHDEPGAQVAALPSGVRVEDVLAQPELVDPRAAQPLLEPVLLGAVQLTVPLGRPAGPAGQFHGSRCRHCPTLPRGAPSRKPPRLRSSRGLPSFRLPGER